LSLSIGNPVNGFTLAGKVFITADGVGATVGAPLVAVGKTNGVLVGAGVAGGAGGKGVKIVTTG
jgi:hypothetical protein